MRGGTFQGGLHQPQVELAALVAVAHALPQAVPLQHALLEAHHVGVLPPQAGQRPELGQRQLHVLGGVATDPLHRQPSSAAARHRLVHHAVRPAADLSQQAVPRGPRAATARPRAHRRSRLLLLLCYRRRHGAAPRSPPPPRRPLCPSAAAVRRFHGSAAGGAPLAPPPPRPPGPAERRAGERRAGEGARAAASEGGKARPAGPFKRSANRGAPGRTTALPGGERGAGRGGAHPGGGESRRRHGADGAVGVGAAACAACGAPRRGRRRERRGFVRVLPRGLVRAARL